MDAGHYVKPRPSAAEQVAGTMFAVDEASAVGVPSARMSVSSAQTAAAISGPFRRKSHREIMLVLGAASGLMSQYQIHRAAVVALNVVNPRIKELEAEGFVERRRLACRSHVKASLRVDGFLITAAGRERLASDLRTRVSR